MNEEKMETWECTKCGAGDTQPVSYWKEQLDGDIKAGFKGLICGNISCTGYWRKVENK